MNTNDASVKETDITVARIYLTEGHGQFDEMMSILHDKHKVMGVTAFRGIAGFGQSGRMHLSGLLDMSLDLPIILEFFDVPEKIDVIVKHLNQILKPGHVITWSAQMNC